MPGVTPTGYETTTLAQIRANLNSAMVQAFGANLDTSLSTPQGQLIAVISDSIATLHEQLQLVYSSFDFRQAGGARLDQLGELRNTPRTAGESDESYRARLLAPTNATAIAVDQLVAAVSAVPGVTRATAQYNATGVTSDNGGQALTLTLIVEGGEDDAVAEAMNDNLVFGLALLGNTASCFGTRSIRFVRPVFIPLRISITTSTALSQSLCGGSSQEMVTQLITDAIEATYNGVGQTISVEFLRAVLVAQGIGIASFELEGANNDGLLILRSYEHVTLDDDSIEVVIGG